MLLDVITKYFPSPFFTKTGINVYDNELFDCIYDEKDFLAARVFKTVSGRVELTYFMCVKR